MHRSLGFIFILFLIIGIPPRCAQAQPPAFEYRAVRVEVAPTIDGHLDDPTWDNIPAISGFIQTWPDDGARATEPSEVRIAYDREHLYFAFRFYDQNPDLIRAQNLERGGRNDRDDHAYIALDTYLDGRNAYLFEMNALGTQDDALITDESITVDSFSWNAVFRSETVIDDKGWTLEVAIPFRELRFPEGEQLEFGLMLSRMINRKNERVMWPPIGMEFGGSFAALAAVSQYGKLTGIKNVRRGKNIEIKPYLIGGAQQLRDDLQTEALNSELSYDFGGDLKYSISSNLTLDLTVNTDFAQVEADNVQLNLTRFNLFFPEKREFFLERSGLFEHGNAQSTQTFFSRRIGLTDQILAGTRIVGQGDRLSYGLMNIETGDEMDQLFGTQSANNTVARFRSKLFNRATAGAIFTNVQESDSYNRALGLDAQYRFGGSSHFTSWITQVWDSDSTHSDRAGHVSFRLQNDRYGAGVNYTSVGPHYRPALGFVRRLDFRQYSGDLLYSPTVELAALPKIQRFQFTGEFDYITGQDGQKQSSEFESEAKVEFDERDYIAIGYTQQFERLFNPFDIRPDQTTIPVDDYTFNRFGIYGGTDSSRRLYGTALLMTGSFFDGNKTDIEASLGFRQSRHLQWEGSINHSFVDLPVPNGNFEATTWSLSLLSALNRKLFAKSLIQYDNFSRTLRANIRLNWIHTPGSDLFLVYNTSHYLAEDHEQIFDPQRDIIMQNQVAILKLTYLIAF
ncbi:MAG: DUF5916 domain-containing protein [Bacteroidota bacterium]